MPYQGPEYTSQGNVLSDIVHAATDAVTDGIRASIGVLTDSKSLASVATGYAVGNIPGAATAGMGVAVGAGVANIYTSTTSAHASAHSIMEAYNDGHYTMVRSDKNAPKMTYNGIKHLQANNDGDGGDYFQFTTSKGQVLQYEDRPGTTAISAYDDLFVYGTSAHELIDGHKSRDVIRAGAGNDVVRAYDGGDKVLGGTGNDDLFGGDGNDWLDGNEGFDFLDGDNGTDHMVAAGGDTLSDNYGKDYFHMGGTGNRAYHFSSDSRTHDVLDVEATTHIVGATVSASTHEYTQWKLSDGDVVNMDKGLYLTDNTNTLAEIESMAKHLDMWV